jgi:hypothetical protein
LIFFSLPLLLFQNKSEEKVYIECHVLERPVKSILYRIHGFTSNLKEKKPCTFTPTNIYIRDAPIPIPILGLELELVHP